MTNNSQKLQDPLNFIPDETFCSILSFLSPHSIAIASAVCRKWRTVIQSDSVNHREIDLLTLDEETEADNVVQHLDRLSSLALNKVDKVQLNLTCFYRGFQIRSKDEGFKSVYDLASILNKSEKSCREVTVLVSNWPNSKSKMQLDMCSFLLLLVKHLRSFNALGSLFIAAPLGGMSLTLKTEGTSRLLSLTEHIADDARSQSGGGAYDPILDLLIVELISQFVKEDTRLVEFSLQHEIPQNFPQFRKILSNSFETLRMLSLCIDPRVISPQEVWSYMLKFKNLTDVSLRLDFSNTEESHTRLLNMFSVPEKQEKRHTELKTFCFQTLKGCEMYWDSISMWAGTHLENVTLLLQELYQRRLPIHIKDSVVHSMILPSQKTLKSIHLSRARFESEIEEIPQDLDSESFKDFPLLHDLTFGDNHPTITKFFSTIKAPNLRRIAINSEPRNHTEVAVDAFVDLLKAYSSNLTHISFHFANGPTSHFELPPWKKMKFSFQNLEVLDLGSLDRNLLADWMSKFKYPNLVKLQAPRHYQVLFQRNSPKLIVDPE